MMSIGVVAAACAAAWFCVFMVFHILGWRRGRGNAIWLIRSYGTTLLAGLVTALVLNSGRASPPSCVLTASIVLLTSGCLFVLYVPAVYVVLTSLSVQTMVFLRQSGGELPVDVLYSRFGGGAIVADRLATLAANHYLREHSGIFRLTRRGRCVATFFRLIKALWKLAPGG